MSFGFGVGDFLDLYDRAKAIVDACRDGPPEFRELAKEVETLQVTMDRLKQDIEDPTSLLKRKAHNREKDMKQILDNCKDVLEEVQAFVDKHSTLERPANANQPLQLVKRVWHAYEVGSADLDNTRGKLTFYTSTIDLFLDSLGAAALGRIEHKVDLIVAQLIAQNKTMNMKLPDDAQSVLSLASDTPDVNAWKALHSDLITAGISESDIESHKDRIVAYARGLITDTLSESDIASRLQDAYDRNLTPSLNASDQRTTMLRQLNVFARRPQLVGKATIDLSVTNVQYGTYGSSAACLIAMEVRFMSTPNHILVASHIFCSLPAGVVEQILDFAPKVAVGAPIEVEKGVSIVLSPKVSVPLSIGPSIEISGASYERRQSQQVPGWALTTSLKPSRNSAAWHVVANTGYDGSLPQHVKLALIVRHRNEPFKLDVERSGTLKSSLRKLTTFGIRKEPVSLPFQPHEDDSILDDIDLEALTAPQPTMP
jgi:hypothetical protein